jgi:hypothetical protein
MHSDQVNPDSNENPEIRDNENQANQLIDQFLVTKVSPFLLTLEAVLLRLLGVQM